MSAGWRSVQGGVQPSPAEEPEPGDERAAEPEPATATAGEAEEEEVGWIRRPPRTRACAEYGLGLRAPEEAVAVAGSDRHWRSSRWHLAGESFTRRRRV